MHGLPYTETSFLIMSPIRFKSHLKFSLFSFIRMDKVVLLYVASVWGPHNWTKWQESAKNWVEIKSREIDTIILMTATIWQVLNMKCVPWPETEEMWISWKLLEMFCETKWSKPIFGGFQWFETTVGRLATPLMLMGFWRAPLKSRHFNFRLTRRKSGLVRLLWNERRTRDPMSASRWFYLGSEQTILCDTMRPKSLQNRQNYTFLALQCFHEKKYLIFSTFFKTDILNIRRWI